MGMDLPADPVVTVSGVMVDSVRPFRAVYKDLRHL